MSETGSSVWEIMQMLLRGNARERVLSASRGQRMSRAWNPGKRRQPMVWGHFISAIAGSFSPSRKRLNVEGFGGEPARSLLQDLRQ